jgi:hypothetical protein
MNVHDERKFILTVYASSRMAFSACKVLSVYNPPMDTCRRNTSGEYLSGRPIREYGQQFLYKYRASSSVQYVALRHLGSQF